MAAIEISELGVHLRDLLLQARERGEMVIVLDQGEIIAHIVPVPRLSVQYPPIDPEESRRAWENLERVAAEISAHWPPGVSAEDAIRDVRREL